jgi:hypothetical protein
LYSDAQYKAPNSLTAIALTESMTSAPLFLYNLGAHPALPGSDLVYHSGINTSGMYPNQNISNNVCDDKKK